MADEVITRPYSNGVYGGASSQNYAIAVPVITFGLRTGKGGDIILGYIQSLDRTHERKLDPIRQLEPYASQDENFFGDVDPGYFPGERVEIVPGPVDSENIKVSRVFIYTSTLFEAFMYANNAGIGLTENESSSFNITEIKDQRYITTLQQIRPVDVYEFYVAPDKKTIIWGIKYVDCWFKDMGHSVKTDDTHIVEEATLEVRAVRFYKGTSKK